MEITKLSPNLLIVSSSHIQLRLNRFIYDSSTKKYSKVYTKWQIERMIYINGVDFELQGVITHHGNETGGHYTAVAGGYMYDDDKVDVFQY